MATNQSWKQRLLVIRFIVSCICHTFLEHPHRMIQFEDGAEPSLFLNIAQLTSKRLHKVRVENSREDFHEIRWSLKE